MNLVILGLSITSSWGNGHATTYRSLIKGLKKRGNEVLFLERDVPWYAGQRDMPNPPFCKTELYSSFEELISKYKRQIGDADMVILGSYVPEATLIAEWLLQTAGGVKAFYDIDTPVTLTKLRNKDYEYINPTLIPGFDIYLSFAGGPVLDVFMEEFGSPLAKPLYCSVDPTLYHPVQADEKWDLGYLGTYSDDRQPPLQKLMIDAAAKWQEGKFVVAGPQYPESIQWPQNVERIDHIPPAQHCNFYNEQKYAMNITRKDMIEMGYSPSVRLFEAAACGVPVISDYWDGLGTFFVPGHEILISESAEETLGYISGISEDERLSIAANARERVLEKHTGDHRALELEQYYSYLKESKITGLAGKK